MLDSQTYGIRLRPGVQTPRTRRLGNFLSDSFFEVNPADNAAVPDLPSSVAELLLRTLREGPETCVNVAKRRSSTL